ncbi:MAG: exodeoxyribonuclease III [Polyangiaceae bacterium]|nr:exodeoxyribonuclease III [Polyangiaceae bacterium]
MRIVSWNVNGLRGAIAKGFGAKGAEGDPEPRVSKGFPAWLSRSRAQIVGLQEVRATEEQLAEHLPSLGRWHRALFAARRPGYSGVALFSRARPDRIDTTLGDDAFDAEGRFQLARFGRLTIVNAYFPNGSGKDRDLSRIPYKLAFYRRVFDLLEAERARGAPILVMGDFNTAHREIDLARPKQNVKTSGFTPVEREELDRWIRAGWVDTFRRFQPGPGHYSWWSQRLGVREKNIGWRIDYVLASPGAVRYLRAAFIHPHVGGSDHCPVGVDVDESIIG